MKPLVSPEVQVLLNLSFDMARRRLLWNLGREVVGPIPFPPRKLADGPDWPKREALPTTDPEYTE